jgi:hypothetical protein
MRLGGTAFDKLALFLGLNDGRAEIERGTMTSRGMGAELDGLINLVAQQWFLRLNAVQTDAAGEKSQNAAHLTLGIDGPWAAPMVRSIGGGGGAQLESQAPPSR